MKRNTTSPQTAATFARRLTILNRYGVYARPSALMVKTASKFDSELFVTNERDHTISGRSIMGWLTLEAMQGAKVTLKATGPDAKELIEELTRLVDQGFGSGEDCLPIPKEHSEWVVLPPPPPPPPVPQPFRVLRVPYALGPDGLEERGVLLRNILPSLRQRIRPARMRLRAFDLLRGTRSATGRAADPFSPRDILEFPRPFFLLLLNGETRRLQRSESIPAEVEDMRAFLRQVSHSKDHPPSNEEVSALVRAYPWNDSAGKYTMRSGISEEEEAILKTVFNRRNAYLRDHCLVLFRTRTVGSAQAPTDGLADLRDALAGHGWKCADYANIEEFGRLGTAHLQRWLEQEIGEQVESWIDRVSPVR